MKMKVLIILIICSSVSLLGQECSCNEDNLREFTDGLTDAVVELSGVDVNRSELSGEVSDNVIRGFKESGILDDNLNINLDSISPDLFKWTLNTASHMAEGNVNLVDNFKEAADDAGISGRHGGISVHGTDMEAQVEHLQTELRNEEISATDAEEAYIIRALDEPGVDGVNINTSAGDFHVTDDDGDGLPDLGEGHNPDFGTPIGME